MIRRVSVLRVNQSQQTTGIDHVVEEAAVTIHLNGEEVVTLLCSPRNRDELGAGFLFMQGILREREELVRVEVDEEKGLVRVHSREGRPLAAHGLFKRVIGSSGGRGFQSGGDRPASEVAAGGGSFSAEAIMELAARFETASEVYRLTGGVHSAALATEKEILVFREDIGRHNAIDKIAGYCLMNGITTADKLLFTTGRVSSEILSKAVRLGVPCLVSRAAPTSVAVAGAEELGITLIGFVRSDRFSVYSRPDRVRMGG
ncbi:MAG: formate dehydrogenase accessory sulfurtransferase FdhD [Clostridia bacterium]|jgi:FdhD protein|nr:formate dehydrogenase accessory sulfurtransferase FdhD [Clostridia bacterium]MDH7573486.1 formate dehydrogenase accessory sulfurtransferase FdhD [Clostridia bacterium]